MKIIIFTLFIAVVVANPLPTKDIEHELIDEDWNLIPDADGNLHIVDINNNIDTSAVEPVFNPIADIFFLLFTSHNPIHGQRINIHNTAQLLGSHFNAANPTRYLIHGWTGSFTAPSNVLVTAAYLARGNFNVIVVDWGVGAQTINYIAARNRVPDVGLVLGQFIDFVNLQTGQPFSAMSSIGHSLGAHIAGFSSRLATRGILASVVALDPAMPLFSINEPAGRVNSNDAIYVESIHTDTGRLGFDEPIGDATFYPNWGTAQPGCGPDPVGNCGHSLVVDFFAESIRNPNAFYGTRCSGWQAIVQRSCPSTGPSMPMGGEPVAQGANGVYFMPTNGASPFGLGWRP